MLSLLLLAFGLSMDAFAVAVCKGLSMGKCSPRGALTVGVWFGVFQALMPVAGYFLGSLFRGKIEAFDHWIACILLVLIGINMLKEAFSKKDEKEETPDITVRAMLPLAVATSIDALAAGIALAMGPNTSIWISALTIGLITCALSAVGVYIGAEFGARFKKKAEIAGGVILILLGLKILAEHLELINF